MADQQMRRFEDDLADLETIVSRIDSGELSLEESIVAFERGVALVRTLNQKLDEVDRRVEILTRGGDGELKRTQYRGEDEAVRNGDDDESEF
jgi:exodeoxyribonuclease VII small subunit